MAMNFSGESPLTYEVAKTLISAEFIYLNPTPLEVVNCPVGKYLTESQGNTLLGVDTQLPYLESKRLIPIA